MTDRLSRAVHAFASRVYWNVFLFIIFFLFVWAYFHHKLFVFLFEHVCAFSLNTE